MNNKINKKSSMFILTFIACITVLTVAFSTVSSAAYTSPTPGGISHGAAYTRGLIDNRTGSGSYDNYRTLSGMPENYGNQNYRTGGVYNAPTNNFSANYPNNINPANNNLNNNYGYGGFAGGTRGLNDTMYRYNMNASNSYTNMNIPNVNNYPHNPSNLGTAVNTDYYANDAYNMYRNNNKCILCRRCVAACTKLQSVSVIGPNERGFDTHIGCAFEHDLGSTSCVSCGQCIVACPTAAIAPRWGIRLNRGFPLKWPSSAITTWDAVFSNLHNSSATSMSA